MIVFIEVKILAGTQLLHVGLAHQEERERGLPQWDKGVYDKPPANVTLSGESFSLHFGPGNSQSRWLKKTRPPVTGLAAISLWHLHCVGRCTSAIQPSLINDRCVRRQSLVHEVLLF